MPNRLLSGPWEHGNESLLKIFLSGGLAVDVTNSTALEMANKGLLAAIEDKKPSVIQLLLSPEVGVQVPDDMTQLAIDQLKQLDSPNRIVDLFSLTEFLELFGKCVCLP